MVELWNGAAIVDLSREFLSSNGAERHASVHIEAGHSWTPAWPGNTFGEKMQAMVGDLNVCCKKGLGERFDSTIGAADRADALRRQIPADPRHGDGRQTAGGRRDDDLQRHGPWGFNPYLTEADPYRGAFLAVVESVTKLVLRRVPPRGYVPDLPGIF